MRENEVNEDKDKACSVNQAKGFVSLSKKQCPYIPLCQLQHLLYIYYGNYISSTLLDCKVGTVR